jgi:3-hydroxypropionyl-CoA synthetase (ADP-forming)
MKTWAAHIETLLRKAQEEGRNRLFEHEVYDVLSQIHIATPTHLFIENEEEITGETLTRFGSERIVVKAVSRSVTHKQRLGGVKVVYKDLDFVRYTACRMRESFQKQGITLEGILLVAHVNYSKDLGNEILLGFRESEAFGPVLSFSKGGSDAEHFAANFSAPNLILPPLNRRWAEALQSSTKIRKKYLEEGKARFIDTIIDTELKFSDLSVQFSNFFDRGSAFVLTEFEINPFVFDEEGNFLALDGFATFGKRDTAGFDLTLKPKESLRPLFEPDGIAVIGVSTTDDTKAGNIILRNLFELERRDVFAVGITEGSVSVNEHSVPVHASVRGIERDIELAVVAVPAEAAISVVEECASKGVRAIILIPGGFSEVTKSKDVEERLLGICVHAGIRLVGPNCLGVLYTGDKGSKGINTFFIPEEKFSIDFEKEKNVAVLSQSGALGITEIYNLRGAISPKVIVSYGNQLDVDPSDLVLYFQDDPAVDVIGLYIEGFKPGAGRKFFDTTTGTRKPIIAYKAGRTEEGKLAAQSHTASIAGEYEVARAAMKQAGLIVADSMIDHGDFIKTFALLHNFQVKGNRVAVIANAGYEKTYAADNLGDLVIADLDEETHDRLRTIIPSYATAEPLLDLTAMASDEMFERCIDTFLSSDQVDALCISIVPHAVVIHTTDREIDSYKENIAARIVNLVHRYRKPVVVSVNVVSGADAAYNRFGQVLDAGGVPTFLTAERAMVCLNEFIRYRLIREKKLFSEWLK